MLDPSPSQLRLMAAAERLVARHGLDGASSRAIIRESGHRNNSAITYYFASRQGLLDSVYRWRSKPINDHRRALMDEMVAAGTQRDPEALVRAFVTPYVEALERWRPSSWARYTVASLAQWPVVFMGDVTRDVKRYEGTEVPLNVTLELLGWMREVACDGREPDAGLRVAVLVRSINATMAAWEQDVEEDRLDQVPLATLADEAIRLGTLVLGA